MTDQLIIGSKASFDDFQASVPRREIQTPAKKSLKETVPFSNATYDFSKIDGEVYWEERKLVYDFEMTASSPEELEEMKAAFANWVMNVFEEDLFDPFIPDYHFRATYAEMSFEDEESMDKTVASVTFMAYPYKIANVPRVYEITVPAGSSADMALINNSSHRVTPTIETDHGITFVYGSTRYAVGAGVVTDAKVKLSPGVVQLTLDNKSGANETRVSIRFTEEVF